MRFIEDLLFDHHESSNFKDKTFNPRKALLFFIIIALLGMTTFLSSRVYVLANKKIALREEMDRLKGIIAELEGKNTLSDSSDRESSDISISVDSLNKKEH